METPVIRYITVGGDPEAWQSRPDQHCPKCGATGPYIWYLESSINENDIGLCLNCATAWIWEYFAEDWIRARVLRLREIGRNPGMVRA